MKEGGEELGSGPAALSDYNLKQLEQTLHDQHDLTLLTHNELALPKEEGLWQLRDFTGEDAFKNNKQNIKQKMSFDINNF